ncbi:hypothetical protein [Brachybacterium sp. YJGR34]|uniref:hypothetical protein n=1 Tax=Brachybacterium sp. YJGR34 TaxID=2059911 RepID=UPI0013009345|nr:hypothetical protein [Brachybacterium sp. YJGR34]
MKRMVAGGIGIVLNLVGFALVPLLLGFVGLVIAGMGSMSLTPLDPRGGTFEASAMSVYGIAVPATEAQAVTCEITGQGVTTEHTAHEGYSVGEVDGIEYVEIYEVQADGRAEVTVMCEGASDVALSDFGVTSILLGAGVGLVLPAVGLVLAIALLVWGIIARVRS